MKILLDAHASGRVVGKALRDDGHDVRAFDADSGLEGLDDPQVLALAVAEERILVTANVRDFVPLLAQHVAGGGRIRAVCSSLEAFGPRTSAP